MDNPCALWYWLSRVKELQRACRGAVTLDRLRGLAGKSGYAPLRDEAQKTERTFASNRWLGVEAARFRKRCDVANDTIIVADFEDNPVKNPGIPAAVIKASDSTQRRAARPEPVKEGTAVMRARTTNMARYPH